MVLLNIVKNTIVSNNSIPWIWNAECGSRAYTGIILLSLKNPHSYAKNSITVTSLYMETTLLHPSLSHRVYPTLL